MTTQQQIIDALDIEQHFDAQQEVERRIDFLADYLKETGAETLVLGISGGVDSTTAGRLCQLAVERIRERGGHATFHAMRLPYGEQHDEDDAQAAINYIRADRQLDVNIKPSADAMLESLEQSGLEFNDKHQRDFVHGNIKARARMIAQYAVAGRHNGLVVGTDHGAEAVMGFFTKHGDGACDLTPLFGLNKRRVRALLSVLDGPESLVNKVPTADLESLSPGRADEDALGVSYDQIDDFLEGKEIDQAAAKRIISTFERTAHKRDLPRSP
ncbi:ammonia-dependent NAD(+) synthetase [Kushneria marisflavi]|uniref:NH(3)-dependent NAD(+) synthetase n=1 Tax=Kushneria marisflavi TaxID=157779 RepID=A0A240UM37_9GAMM|nr:ammonia-dependent NAD(+) synthetase [Kushneria marisflavi]ART62567.1 NAD(+) synthase [Kushneria marisflavi]RKD84057.1 NH(3)-dependent NAD(+) synthetase [Kushneria marisflavi]